MLELAEIYQMMMICHHRWRTSDNPDIRNSKHSSTIAIRLKVLRSPRQHSRELTCRADSREMVFEELKTLLCLEEMGLLLEWRKIRRTTHPQHLIQLKVDNSSQVCLIWQIKIVMDKPNELTAVVAESDRKVEQETTQIRLQVNSKLNNSHNHLQIRALSKMF